ncbi:PIN domain-containing protein [Nocardiopsis trehalosi]|jgi:predicted nucleic acid-binding protein|uniref:PIN domain-containing protein n=1 Tax=Nocardiopsis trehalosi TaxID=109329 RepID=UPI000831563C|nr:PIN domain-containing protein [Nocardiopsis trehalosi]
MASVALYDANVLYPSTLRDLVIRVAQAGLVRAKWSNRILDEVFDNLRRNRPELPDESLERTRALMLAAVRDALVTGHEPLIDAMRLPDPDDRHVLAAAVRARADVIVTWNLRDFPSAALGEWGIQAKSPDVFLADLIEVEKKVVWACVQQIADSWRRPPGTIEDVLARLERNGLVQVVAELRSSDADRLG